MKPFEQSFFCRLLVVLSILASFVATSQVACAAGTINEDWNVAVLDQLLAAVQPGQSFVQIDDMEISVSYLQQWRNKLAGGPQPNIAFSGTFTKWPGGDVYYAFDASVSTTNQRAFRDAAAEWATFANLHFIARTAEANYILVTNNPSLGGGLSFVGMVGGAQLLQIGPSAWNRHTLCHELGHALGLVHEHQRSDRDAYVTIDTNNIQSGHLGDFVKLTDSDNLSSYDFLSVMHYSRNAFSVDANSNTIVPLPAYSQYLNVMGDADPVLSADDRAGMATMYGAGPGATNLVTNTQDGGPGSLRAALYYAFDHPGTTISFDIPTSDAGFSNNVFNILPTDALPGIYNDTVIDGGTEPGDSNPFGPDILLDGARCQTPSTYTSGLRFKGTNSVAQGLVVNNFPDCGILMDGSSCVANIIRGCYLGIDPTGTVAITNGYYPVLISGGAVSNTVGGLTVSARNIIGGSFYQGVIIRDDGTRFNTVEGNYIGINAAGTVALPNRWAGIEIYGGAQSNRVGGYTASARNVISGNGFQGVVINDTNTDGNVVAGNYIGLNAAGTAAVPNSSGTSGFAGAEIFGGARHNYIGGTAAGAGNVISGNASQGVVMDGAGTSDNFIEGNFIGLNPAGTAAIGNGWAGVNLFGGATGNFIGGDAPGAGNVISGNNNEGVLLQNAGTSGNYIERNWIGLAPDGNTAVSNAWSGLEFYYGASSNFASDNVISGNGQNGVVFNGTDVNGNTVSGNIIGLNAAGTAAVGNGWAGAYFYYGPQNNLLGGNVPAARNVISGNGVAGGDGVVLAGSATTGNTVAGNFIGLNAAGDAAMPNIWSGLELYDGAADNLIGGYGAARNFISGNDNYGININNNSSGNIIQGNSIGLDAKNSGVIPNTWTAVVLFAGATSNLLGGATIGAANLISGSTGNGVELYDAGTTNNTIRGNSIFNSAYAGIGLYGLANQNIAPPTLTSAIETIGTAVSGSYTGAPGMVYQLDFYADAPPASSAEARTYLGSTNITGTGSAAGFTASLGAFLPTGRAVTATATDSTGNTSPLSTGVAVTMTSTPKDGIPDAWRALYFGGSGTTTNSQSASFADPDMDGLNNYQEFLAGTNPTNSASVLKLAALNPNTSPNVVSLKSANGIVYRVEYRDSLSAGYWSILADQISGNGTNIFLPDAGAADVSQRFYRAQVLW